MCLWGASRVSEDPVGREEDRVESLGEDRDSTRSHEEPDHDQGDPVQDGTTDRGHDSGHDEHDGDEPQDEFHDEVLSLGASPPNPPSQRNGLALGMSPNASIVFDPEPASVSAARTWVTKVVRQWSTDVSIPTEVVDAVRLVVSELMGNAVRHARTRIRATLWIDHDDVLWLEVEDGSASPLRARGVEVRSIDGRGLALVERLSTRWGVKELRHGKVVWATWDLPSFPALPDGDS